MKTSTLALAAAMGLAASAASAATVSYSDTVALQFTDWNETLQVNQFDTGLGTLTGVSVTLTGGVTGDANAESLSAAAAIISLELNATITAATTALGTIGSVLPIASQTFTASAFDGTMDFGGTSGTALSGLTDSDSTSTTLTGVDMAEFIGAGFVSIDVAAEGEAFGSGAGNLITLFSNQATATVTVQYTYDEFVAPVPLPAGGALLLAALGGLGYARRKQA